MSKSKSGIWSVALPLSVVFLGAAYYLKVEEVRQAVDARTPVVRNLLGRYVQEAAVQTIVMPGEQDPAFAKPRAAPAPAQVQAPPAPARVVPATPEPVAPPVASIPAPAPATVPAPALLDLPSIAADRSLWPKKVTLQKATKFPAVLNGKIVGEVIAPAGTEATLKQVKDDKVGLELNGGGAWLPADQTDLIARARSSR